MDMRNIDDGSRGELLVEYHWVAGPFRVWAAVALVLLAVVTGVELARSLALFPEYLKPHEGMHVIAKPLSKGVTFVIGALLYFAKTSFHLNALQVSWRTTPIPLFVDGAASRSEIVEIALEKFPGVPEFLANRSYALAAVLRSGEKRYMLQMASREPSLEIGQLLAAEMKKPGPR